MNHNLIFLFSAITIFFNLSAHSSPPIPWSNQRQKVLVEAAQKTAQLQLPTFPKFEYPLACPRCLIDLFVQDKALIFTYGSLISKPSAARTVSPKALSTFRPAVAFGLKRVFDRHVPFSQTWGKQKRKSDTAMLNVWIQYDLSQIVNGVLMEVGEDDLIKLCQREVGYDLIAVPVVLWENALNESSAPHMRIAYTFASPREARNHFRYTRPCINPYKRYADMIMEATKGHGEAFFKLFKATTYLSDGETLFESDEDQNLKCSLQKS